LIGEVSDRLGGALALLSGRPLEQVERCLAPFRFPLAGLHGLERRGTDGNLRREPASAELRAAAAELRLALSHEPRARLEDKGAVLALHYRLAPERAEAMQRLARSQLLRLGAHYRLLAGADVIELLPRHVSKGTALREFMAEEPFRGRRPVCIGDDITDLDGFEAARQLGGFGVAVGTRVNAEFHLSSVAAVHHWLEEHR
jgi:trehalose 6-phosphate phosphatase